MTDTEFRLAPLTPYHSGYYNHDKAKSVRRVHITHWSKVGAACCGQHARGVTNSPLVAVEQVPEGLSWCPHCIGRAAEHLGRLEHFGIVILGRLK